MKERIQRILDLVAAGRLGQDDAAQLLAALSPKLTLSEEARPHVFGLLTAPDFGVDKVSAFLLLSAGVARPPFPPGPPGRRGGLDDLGDRISSAVESAFEGAFGQSRTPRSGRVLRVEAEDEEGNSFSANLPLSLAEHTARLLPPRLLKLLERQGLTPEALTLLLQANPPVGPLLELEDSEGASLSLRVE